MRSKNGWILALSLVLGLSAAVQAAPVPTAASSAITVTSLWDSETYFTCNGLMKDGDLLYFGNYDTVRTYDLGTATVSEYASIGGNADTKAFGKVGSTIYMAMDTSYSKPYPSNLGTVDGGGFSATLSSGTELGATTYSIFDAAVNGGNYYFVANPGTIEDPQGNPTGTNIYKYNTSDPTSPILVANIGGNSGGLTFDTAGNMYYASQNTGEGVLKFTAAQVATGGLTAADGMTVVNITGSSLGFLSTGELIAETGYGAALAAYDITTGEKLYDIASISGGSYPYMSKFVVGEDDTIYMISTVYATDSNLSAITVPEPTTMGLLALGGLLALKKRRYR